MPYFFWGERDLSWQFVEQFAIGTVLAAIRMQFRSSPLLASEKGMCCVSCKNGHDGIDRVAKAHVRMRQIIKSRQKKGEKCQRNRLLTAVPNRHDQARKSHHRNERVHENIRNS